MPEPTPPNPAVAPSAYPPEVQAKVGVPRPAVRAFTLPHGAPLPPPSPGTIQHPPVEIPEGDALVVGERLAAARVPTADAAALRLGQIARDLEQAVDDARCHPAEHRSSLTNFTAFVGQLLAEQATLRRKIGSDPGPAVEAEAYRLVTSIRGFSDGSVIRAHRSLLAGYLQSDLAACESKLQSLLSPGHSAMGALQHEAVTRAAAQGLLTTKAQLLARITSLDATGDEARGSIMQTAISAAGGSAAVVAKLAPALPGA
jgi:hypothetical protein